MLPLFWFKDSHCSTFAGFSVDTNLGADLVTALASLEMNDFPHLALDLNRLLPSWTNLSVDWGPWLPIPAAA